VSSRRSKPLRVTRYDTKPSPATCSVICGAQPHFLDAVGPQIVDGDDVYFMVTD
jgi:hypothetical protein